MGVLLNGQKGFFYSIYFIFIMFNNVMNLMFSSDHAFVTVHVLKV